MKEISTVNERIFWIFSFIFLNTQGLPGEERMIELGACEFLVSFGWKDISSAVKHAEENPDIEEEKAVADFSHRHI